MPRLERADAAIRAHGSLPPHPPPAAALTPPIATSAPARALDQETTTEAAAAEANGAAPAREAPPVRVTLVAGSGGCTKLRIFAATGTERDGGQLLEATYCK